MDDAIATNNNEGDPETVAIVLGQVEANMAAIEDMHRDRMIFLDFASDPNSSAIEKDYARTTSSATSSRREYIKREAPP